MNVEALQAFGLHDEAARVGMATPAGATAGEVPFAGRVADSLLGLNEQLLGTQRDLQQLAVGQVENLHEIMIRLEESRMSLQLMLQVRSRALEAYQDVMRMQV